MQIAVTSGKIPLVGFHYEPVSLDVNEACFEEEKNIPNTRKKSRKCQSFPEWCRCGKCTVAYM